VSEAAGQRPKSWILSARRFPLSIKIGIHQVDQLHWLAPQKLDPLGTMVSSIDCPLSSAQRRICRTVLSHAKQLLQIAAEQVLRVCSHAFAVEGSEYALGALDFFASSTKLLVFDSLLASGREEGLLVFILVQFTVIADLITDLAELRDCLFFDYGSDPGDPPEDTSLLLYNTRHS
jgi:hypothetical protein